jgi:hypothetical protein
VLHRAARDAIVSRSRAAAEPGTREEEVEELALREYRPAAESFGRASGAGSVEQSRKLWAMKKGEGDGVVQEFLDSEINAGGPRVKEVQGRTFYLQGARWVDAALLEKKPEDEPEKKRVKYLSDGYFELLSEEPGIGKFLSVGPEVSFLWKGKMIVVET